MREFPWRFSGVSLVYLESDGDDDDVVVVCVVKKRLLCSFTRQPFFCHDFPLFSSVIHEVSFQTKIPDVKSRILQVCFCHQTVKRIWLSFSPISDLNL